VYESLVTATKGRQPSVLRRPSAALRDDGGEDHRAENLLPADTGAVDDLTAAALPNPAMSSWLALAWRARLEPGETVLIHGATGVAGRLAVQLAKHLGA
jgi:NADPH:quinone reductase-like Zn-dependent oxidoreductase